MYEAQSVCMPSNGFGSLPKANPYGDKFAYLDELNVLCSNAAKLTCVAHITKIN